MIPQHQPIISFSSAVYTIVVIVCVYVVCPSGLLPYAPYQVRVSATSPAGRGDTSPHVSFTTDTGGTVWSPPNTHIHTHSLCPTLSLSLSHSLTLSVSLSLSLSPSVPKQFNTPQDLAVSSSGPRSITVQWTVHPDIEDTSYAFTWWAEFQYTVTHTVSYMYVPSSLPPSLPPSLSLSSITVTSAVTPPRTVEGVGGVAGVEVVALMPNTLYLVTLMLRFEGGGLGPPVEQQTTTLEDGEEREREEGGREGGGRRK